MKAVRFHEFGEPGVLRYEDVEVPVPAAGEVRVRVAATSFNPIDGNIRAGFMQGPFPVRLPHTPGVDVAGTVDSLGERVTGFDAGAEVIAFLPMAGTGASAEYAIVPAEILAPAPRSIPLADAAALPAVGLTAWQALFDHAKLSFGQRVLITGAGGAVGEYAVQLTRRAGAHVIATTGPTSSDRATSPTSGDQATDLTNGDQATSPTNGDQATSPTSGDRARESGAAEVYGPGIPALSSLVDVVVNLAPVDQEELAGLVAVIRDGGVLVNAAVWMPAPSDEARGVRGIDMYVRSDREQLTRLSALVDDGDLRVRVTGRVPLADLQSVHTRASSGKVVIVP
ncbi:NADP-dependent oxidoreductase [Actinoplanes couchii]|uniref:NADPH:quinone reductase n=1 Tax=Actinoplanes couchii TaxID=403638 RepID=A0ABQ3XE39_9ACTN|nr:NADP-dependent oxidoreductase [Actinoplanes couchii]GID56670.1 NADPH:quinone reductase [Actinoplanes couchii]